MTRSEQDRTINALELGMREAVRRGEPVVSPGAVEGPKRRKAFILNVVSIQELKRDFNKKWRI